MSVLALKFPVPVFRGRRRRGQSVLEYAVLIAVVVAALLAMQMYMKRGLSGGWRTATDSIGEQYEPKNTTSDLTLTMTGVTNTKAELKRDQLVNLEMVDPVTGQVIKISKADVMETTTTIDAKNPETTTKSGSETVGAIGTDLWK